MCSASPCSETNNCIFAPADLCVRGFFLWKMNRQKKLYISVLAIFSLQHPPCRINKRSDGRGDTNQVSFLFFFM